MIYMLSATATEVFTTIGYILLALFCLMVMVVIHEFGHYLAGRLLGFGIKEFAVGFGPKIFKWTNKKSGMIFSIRPLPLGGFCQFVGEDEEDSDPSAFNNKAPWKRLIVLFSGAFFNLISAFIVIAVVFCAYGQLLPKIGEIQEESAIFQEGKLQVGDVILKVNGKNVNILMNEDITNAFNRIEDKGTFTVLRNGEKVEISVSKSDIYERDTDGNILYKEDGTEKTYFGFGISTGLVYQKLGFFTALARSFSYTFFLVFKILWIFGQLFTGQLSFMESAGGPVAVVGVITQATRTGIGALMYTVCIISANLAVMNLLPLPALDGSRMVFTTIEWIAGKPINRRVEAIIHTIGMLLLFGFAIFADFSRLIS